MYDKCIKNQIDFLNLPLFNIHIINFCIAFFKLTLLLIKQKKIETIFVFEGREHTIAGIHKLLFPFLWKKKKLIRVRGQAQMVKKHIFSFLLYRFLTDKIIYTAYVIAHSIPYKLPITKFNICAYGKTLALPEQAISYYHIKPLNYDINFEPNTMTFFMVGRFDPIKGHDLLIRSFLNTDFKNIKTQLICVGTKQSISAQNIYDTYKEHPDITDHFKRDWIYHLSTDNRQKRVILIENQFDDLYLFMKNATFGVISSLGSETICRVGVEFLQAGIPVIYSDAGALTEVLSDFPDLKFKSSDETELIEKFEFAAQVFTDPEKLHLEKYKAYESWKTNYQGNVYSDILK